MEFLIFGGVCLFVSLISHALCWLMRQRDLFPELKIRNKQLLYTNIILTQILAFQFCQLIDW